jgi:hypothetical protein
VTQIEVLNRRYQAVAALAQGMVEIVVVADPAGARWDVLTRRLLDACNGEGESIWADLAEASNGLRWRRATQPQPLAANPLLRAAAEQVIVLAVQLRGAVSDEAVLEEVEQAAVSLLESDSPVGDHVLRSVNEVGVDSGIVVAASRSAQAAMQGWLGEMGVRVMTVADLLRERPKADVTYHVGPPRFFSAATITAPVTNEVSFVMPVWIADRTLPTTVFAAIAERTISIDCRILTEGASVENESASDVLKAENYIPEPIWRYGGVATSPVADGVEARKVLLAGNQAIWLDDDGDRIRTLDPSEPQGERVTYTEVASVRPGTYLLLRQGETERGALHLAAIAALALSGPPIASTQARWKELLSERLTKMGYRTVVAALKDSGIMSADRARAWIDPALVRPQDDDDFASLLVWLGIPIQPTFSNALILRKSVYQASADLRDELERAVASTDLASLDRVGYLHLDTEVGGYRGIQAARVLTMSPDVVSVPRRDVRVPFNDWGGQWLE